MKKAPESDVLSSSPDICVNVVSYKDVADVSVILFTYAEHVVCCLCHRVTHRPAYRGVSQTKPHMLDQVTCLDIWDLKRGSDRRFSLHLFCVFKCDETLCWHIVPPHIIHETKHDQFTFCTFTTECSSLTSPRCELISANIQVLVLAW